MNWEYKTIPVPVADGNVKGDEVDEALNKLGSQGWELFSVSPLLANGETCCLVHHFRRPAERGRRAGFQA